MVTVWDGSLSPTEKCCLGQESRAHEHITAMLCGKCHRVDGQVTEGEQECEGDKVGWAPGGWGARVWRNFSSPAPSPVSVEYLSCARWCSRLGEHRRNFWIDLYGRGQVSAFKSVQRDEAAVQV